MQSSVENALEVHNLTVHYENVPVLWDINLSVPRGSWVGILGPNGAGKSTFVQAILGLLPVVSGQVYFFQKKKEECRGKIAYMPQRASIDWNFPITAKELVLMGLYPKMGMFRRVKKEEIEKVERALEEVGMFEYRDRQIGKLSGGQQQRLFLARALIQDAEAYFLDEPLAGIDHSSEEIIMRILHEMKEKKKSIFMVHHDLNSAATFFDWAILLNLRLVKAGSMEVVFQPKYLQEAYGRSLLLYDEVSRMAKEKALGINGRR